MISKMSDDGSRIAVVLNGSPLFSGGAGSGESEIRRWIIIFDNADFGYQRVTVERPLRLNFCMERIDLVKATKGFQKF